MNNRPTPETDVAEAKRRAEWLHKHKAHKDWIILSVSEVAVIRDELLILERERDEAREAFREMWQSGDAFLPYIDKETTNRWRKAAGWEETK